jgi:sulfite reductase beta subunit-like hemoprotein
VACPGTTWCARGIADARAAGAAIEEKLPRDAGMGVCISGCPNNCAQSAVADMGLVGRIKTMDGVRTEAFRLLAGGERGRGPGLAVELAEAVPARLAADAAAIMAREYALAAKSGTPWPEHVGRHRERLSGEVARLVATPGAHGDARE